MIKGSVCLIFIIMNDFALNEGSFFVLVSFFFPVGEDDGQQAKNDFVYKRDEIW